MFIKYSYYKHTEGRDAVIQVRDVRELDEGYELMITWHCLAYHGGIYGAATQVTTIFISNEQSQFWSLYEGECL